MLLHRFYNLETLRMAYFCLKKEAAPSVDGKTWRDYGRGAGEESPRPKATLSCIEGSSVGLAADLPRVFAGCLDWQPCTSVDCRSIKSPNCAERWNVAGEHLPIVEGGNLDSNLQFWLYVILKFAVYAGWCALGLFLVRRAVTLWTSLSFGFLRLAIGIAFGLAIFIVGGMMHLNPPPHPLAVYVSVYAPVRVVEWLVMYMILRKRRFPQRALSASLTVSWVLAGVVVSFIADVPMLLTYEGAKQFLPVGRFLC